jgi:hypothetical protein
LGPTRSPISGAERVIGPLANYGELLAPHNYAERITLAKAHEQGSATAQPLLRRRERTSPPTPESTL